MYCDQDNGGNPLLRSINAVVVAYCVSALHINMHSHLYSCDFIVWINAVVP